MTVVKLHQSVLALSHHTKILLRFGCRSESTGFSEWPRLIVKRDIKKKKQGLALRARKLESCREGVKNK
jgi:hypothetical protein